MPTTFDSLVDDVLVVISAHLSRQTDLLHFGLSGPRLWPLVTPYLYSELTLRDRSWEKALSYLDAYPDLAVHVRSLKLQSDQSYGMDRNFPTVALVAVIQRAHSLKKFIWDLPWHMSEDLWSALLLRRETLTSFGFGFGPFAHHIKQLLAMRHLHIRFCTFHSYEPTEDGLKEMWYTIRHDCPYLQTLTVTGADSPVSETAGREVVLGNWPRLRVLSVERGPKGDPFVTTPASSILRFLERTPTLKVLNLSGGLAEPPASFSSLQKESLPELHHFRGSIFQAATLRCKPTLQSLHISQPMRLNDGIVGGIVQVLARFKLLIDLKLFLNCEKTQGTAELLAQLFAPCSKLLKLKLVITTLPVAAADVFADILRTSVPHMTDLCITVVPSSPTSTLEHWSWQIMTALPHLQSLELAFIGQGSQAQANDVLIPHQYAEYEIIRAAGEPPHLIRHRQGFLWSKSSTLLDVSSDVKLHRRYFGRLGWVLYSNSADTAAPLTYAVASRTAKRHLQFWTVPSIVAVLAMSICWVFIYSSNVHSYT